MLTGINRKIAWFGARGGELGNRMHATAAVAAAAVAAAAAAAVAAVAAAAAAS